MQPYSSIMAIVFGFMSENLKGMPIEIIKDLTGLIEEEIKKNYKDTDITWIKESNKSKKKLVNYMQGIFELIAVFLSVKTQF